MTETQQSQGSYKSYLIGFVLSIVFTLTAYFLTTGHVLEAWTLALTISALAVAQVFVQLFFFLHLAEEQSPRWNLIAFIFMAIVVVIIVGGSLWIMYNLDYHMASPINPSTQLPNH